MFCFWLQEAFCRWIARAHSKLVCHRGPNPSTNLDAGFLFPLQRHQRLHHKWVIGVFGFRFEILLKCTLTRYWERDPLECLNCNSQFNPATTCGRIPFLEPAGSLKWVSDLACDGIGFGFGFHYSCSILKLNLTCLPSSSPDCSSSPWWRGSFNVLCFWAERWIGPYKSFAHLVPRELAFSPSLLLRLAEWWVCKLCL